MAGAAARCNPLDGGNPPATSKAEPDAHKETPMSEAEVIIYHNPQCGTSRNTLARIREAGIEPKVVEYLKEGWTKPQLKEILKKLGKTPRDIFRLRGNEAHEHIIKNPNSTDDEILDAMVGHPILVQRPIVVTPKGAVLARPPEEVDSIL
jgi:arsenate reductase